MPAKSLEMHNSGAETLYTDLLPRHANTVLDCWNSWLPTTTGTIKATSSNFVRPNGPQP